MAVNMLTSNAVASGFSVSGCLAKVVDRGKRVAFRVSRIALCTDVLRYLALLSAILYAR